MHIKLKRHIILYYLHNVAHISYRPKLLVMKDKLTYLHNQSQIYIINIYWTTCRSNQVIMLNKL